MLTLNEEDASSQTPEFELLHHVLNVAHEFHWNDTSHTEIATESSNENTEKP